MHGIATLASAPESRSVTSSDVGWFDYVRSGGTRPVTPHSALTLAAVWACETLIADSIASLPAGTYRKREPVREPVRPPGWLNQPNPETNRVDFETQRVLSLLGWGNAYTLLVRRDGTTDPHDPVIERWIVAPWEVQVGRNSPGGPLVYLVNGTPVPTGNIQHIRGHTLPGAFKGMSVIEQAAQSLGLGQNAESFSQKFYENGIVPTGVLEAPELPAETSKSIIDRLREQFAERYAGPANAHKPIVLTGGTKWQQTMMTPTDAQFLETRKFQVEQVCTWFRVPPHEIEHITDHASQGGGKGIEAQSLNMARRTLTPWTVRLEQADTQLLPRGQYMKFNLNAFVRADIRTRFAVYQMGRNMGVYSANDVRAYEDESPIENGDIYLQPKNMGEAGNEPLLLPPGSDEGTK